MQLQSIQTNDAFLHIPPYLHQPPSTSHSKPVTLLFFITGNPGLLSYYHEFFALLSQPPSATSASASTNIKRSTQDCIIAGFSLGGFEDRPLTEHDPVVDSLLFPPAFKRHPAGQTYTLQDQIELTHARLQHLTSLISAQFSPSSKREGQAEQISVVLQGHSVGAYIALSLLGLIHARHSELEGECEFVVKATHLLTPTITRLAASASGRVATRMLGVLPVLPSLAQGGASVLSGFLPEGLLRGVVGGVTGMKGGSAGLETTVRFLGGGARVRQTLDLAAWELKEIGEERWAEDVVWGADKGSIADGEGVEYGREEGKLGLWKAPQHYFLFAKKDHWVADETRQEIITARQGKARIVVDESGELVHAWCLGQSGLVAGWIRAWIEEMFDRDES